MSDREHMLEPIPGLPERPPPGERLLWQGAPHWRTLARRTFHVRKVALYLGVFVAWRYVWGLMQGQGVFGALQSSLLFIGLSAAALGLLLLLAWLTARATLYTITTERVVMRFGISFQMAVNLPFPLIRSAALKTYPDGTGDIPMQLQQDERVSYIVMWPHVRPWTFGHAQPMLRGIDDAASVAQLLSRALSREPVSPIAGSLRDADEAGGRNYPAGSQTAG
jgi:hypothetical protein